MIELNFQPEPRQLRTFGLVGLGVLGILGALAYWRQSLLGIGLGDSARTWALGLWCTAGALGALALAAPALLRPMFIGMSVVSLPIGLVVSTVVLAAVYFLIVTPLGLFFRLKGRDPLHRRFDRNRDSYWEPRRAVVDMARYFRQY